jgi:hypothetical protein
MKKLLVPLLLLVLASGGCILVEDEGRPRHVHCIGCGHVYVKGTWR